VIVSYEHEEDAYAALAMAMALFRQPADLLLMTAMHSIKAGRSRSSVHRSIASRIRGYLAGRRQFAVLIKKTVDEMHADSMKETLNTNSTTSPWCEPSIQCLIQHSAPQTRPGISLLGRLC
jgi:hypothetical protein